MNVCEIERDGFFYQVNLQTDSPHLWSFLEMAPNYGNWSMRRFFNHLDDLLHFIKHHCGEDVLAEVLDSTILREISNE